MASVVLGRTNKKTETSGESMAAQGMQDLKKYQAELRRRGMGSGATGILGLSLESMERGRVVFRMRVKARHKQLQGVVHGGILTTLADTAAAIAAYTTVPKETRIATVELKINFLEPVASGWIRAEARVLRTGRNFVVTECEILNEKGSMAAKALLTFGAARGHSLKRK